MSSSKIKELNGAHVPHRKGTAERVPERMPIPAQVCISMSQNMGKACEPKVQVGDTVKMGQLIGDTEAFMSAPVHSSVSGTVSAIEERIIGPGGLKSTCIVIDTDGKQEEYEGIAPVTVESKDDFVKAVRASGLVGLGGAGFPTHIKMNPPNLNEVDTLVVNAAECEPYITCDYRTMMDHTQDVLDGIRLIQKHLDIANVYIGIENNKPDAIALLRKKTEHDASIHVAELSAVYPKGAEKVIVYECCGRVIKEGTLPAASGVIVSNVTSIAVLAQYIRTGMPLIQKCLTVDGSAVGSPKNVLAPIGTRFSDILAFCDTQENPAKVISGGPMMGIAVDSLSQPLSKTNNAILAFTAGEAEIDETTPCIRCARCIRACPMNLMPINFEKAYIARDTEDLRALKINLCIECGCCSYVCPAKRNLTYSHKLSKQLVRESKR